MVCPDFRTGRPDFRMRVEAAKMERVVHALGWSRAKRRPDFRTPNGASASSSQSRCMSKQSDISKLRLARNSRRRSFVLAWRLQQRLLSGCSLSGVTGAPQKNDEEVNYVEQKDLGDDEFDDVVFLCPDGRDAYLGGPVATTAISPQADEDPALQEIIAAIKRLDQNLMKETYSSALRLISDLVYTGSVSRAQYEDWHYKVTRAIADIEASGLGAAMTNHLVDIATRYDYPGLPDPLRSDLLNAGMPQSWIESVSLAKKSEIISAAEVIQGMGYTNYLFSLVTELDTTLETDGRIARLTPRMGGGHIVLASANASRDALSCVFAIVGSIATAIGVLSCAAAASGVALASCIASILNIPVSATAVLVECFGKDGNGNDDTPQGGDDA